MIKKLMLAVAMFVASTGFAFAQVDVNKADAAALDGVKGVGDKRAAKLSQAGLQVNGMAKEGAAAAKAEDKGAKSKTAAKPETAAKPAT